jgi:hypothetical protein
MSDVLIRDSETGQFRSTTRYEVADDYIQSTYGDSIDYMTRLYERVTSSAIGRFLFA